MVSLVERLEEAHRRAIDLLWFVEENDILEWSDGGIVTIGEEEEEELEEERKAKAAAMLKPGKGTSQQPVAPEEEEKRAELPPPSHKFQSTDMRFWDNYVPKMTRQ